MSAVCPNGHENPEGAAFCNTCGSPLEVKEVADTPQPGLVEGESAASPQAPTNSGAVVTQFQGQGLGEVPLGDNIQSVEEPSAYANPTLTKRARPKWLIPVVVVAGVVVAAVVVVLVIVLPNHQTPLERAGASCSGTAPLERELATPGATTDPTGDAALQAAFGDYLDGVVSVEDNGQTLVVQTKSQDDDPLGVGVLAIDCVADELQMPDSVKELVLQTRSIDGRLSGEWKGFSASWGYHPDNGLNMIITMQ